jgi:hypothetical protein
MGTDLEADMAMRKKKTASRKKAVGKKSAGKRKTSSKRGGKTPRGPMKSDVIRPPQ